MDSIEITHRNCKYFDTYKCLLRKHHNLIDQIKMFCKLSPSVIITADEYLEFKDKCNKVCTDCDKFERKETG